MSATISDPQRLALVKLKAQVGEGVLDKHGKIVAGGERLLGFDPVTWLRLLTTGHVEVRGDLRVGITAKGEAAAVAKPVRINPHGIHSRREPIPAHSGAE